MKVKDAEKAMSTQTLVAVCNYHPQGDPAPYGAKPATLQALRQPRKVYSGARWDFSGHNANDGMQVQYEDGSKEIVGPTDVLSTWDDYQVALAAKQEHRNASESARELSRARAEQAMTRLREVLGPEHKNGVTVAAITGGGHNFTVLGYEVRLTSTAAAKLADKLSA